MLGCFTFGGTFASFVHGRYDSSPVHNYTSIFAHPSSLSRDARYAYARGIEKYVTHISMRVSNHYSFTVVVFQCLLCYL